MRRLASRSWDACAFCALACIVLIPTMASAAQGSGTAVRVWEAQLSIPTYELGPPDPDPALLNSRGTRPVYPYPMLDNLTDRRVQKSYKAVYVENGFLRVTVLPELGGRLYAIYDKAAKRDVLYTNHVVKYGLVALRGAWISGGIEWNFPDGHTVTTVSPVDYTILRENDGSAGVVVGDTERVQRMQWAVAIRLRPGRKAVETEVTLINRREVPGRYWYWANAAAPATEDLRFVYPMREAYPHAFWPVFSFPKFNGVDLGTYREVPSALSLFARNSKKDFFGVYYEKSDWGIVHVADHDELAGKKTWTWGTDPAGKIWINKLTEADGQYVEFQAGRFETQLEHEFIPPHRVERFVEYWYPVQGMGGPFNEANPFAALRLSIGGRRAQIALNSTVRVDGAQVLLEQDGNLLYGEQLTLSPDRPFATAVDLPQLAEDRPVTLRLKSADGWDILTYQTDTPVDGNQEFRPAERPAPDPEVAASTEKAYLNGVSSDKKSDDQSARASYLEALKIDQGYSPAQVALGLLCYRNGQYDAADAHLAAALRRNPDSAEGHYYLGLVRKARGLIRDAADNLTWVARSGRMESLARYNLGTLAIAAGNLQEALGQLSRSVLLEPRDIKARTTLALAERLAGRVDAAVAHIEAAVRDMPLDYFALSEQAAITRASGQADAARRAEQELWRLLSREPDSILELVFDYAGLGRTGECLSLLQTAVQRAAEARAPAYPMLHYALGYFLERSGDKNAALAQYALGAAGNPDYVFPHRVEEMDILRSALAANPSDGRAAYYLGNVLAANGRGPEALQTWRIAAELDKTNAVARRNLALALWRVIGDKEEAASVYAQAIELAPDDAHLYVERDNLLTGVAAADRRVRQLEAVPSSLKSRSSIVQALAGAYVDADRFGDAVALLERSSVTAGEGEFTALATYRRACLGLARKYQLEGRHELAASAFLKATEYPANLGVGRSSAESHAREYVEAARELDSAGNTDAAESLWRRAADEPLGSPVQTAEPWSEHYYYKAVALLHIGRSKEAHDQLYRLAALADDGRTTLGAGSSLPEGSLRFVLAGLALKALGRRDEAVAAFGRALAIDPENARARTELRDPVGSPKSR
jgi:tetratricopeptide (TPR) repeat protein